MKRNETGEGEWEDEGRGELRGEWKERRVARENRRIEGEASGEKVRSETGG